MQVNQAHAERERLHPIARDQKKHQRPNPTCIETRIGLSAHPNKRGDPGQKDRIPECISRGIIERIGGRVQVGWDEGKARGQADDAHERDCKEAEEFAGASGEPAEDVAGFEPVMRPRKKKNRCDRKSDGNPTRQQCSPGCPADQTRSQPESRQVRGLRRCRQHCRQGGHDC